MHRGQGKQYLLLLGILLAVISVSTSYSQVTEEGPVNIAVLDLDISYGIEETISRPLSDRLRHELFMTERFVVVERNMMEQILSEQGFQQSGCISDECAVQVGRLLGVHEMIAGSLARVGQVYTLSVRMINVETGELVSTYSIDCECQIEEILTTRIRFSARLLAGLETPPEPIELHIAQNNDQNIPVEDPVKKTVETAPVYNEQPVEEDEPFVTGVTLMGGIANSQFRNEKDYHNPYYAWNGIGYIECRLLNSVALQTGFGYYRFGNSLDDSREEISTSDDRLNHVSMSYWTVPVYLKLIREGGETRWNEGRPSVRFAVFAGMLFSFVDEAKYVKPITDLQGNPTGEYSRADIVDMCNGQVTRFVFGASLTLGGLVFEFQRGMALNNVFKDEDEINSVLHLPSDERDEFWSFSMGIFFDFR